MQGKFESSVNLTTGCSCEVQLTYAVVTQMTLLSSEHRAVYLTRSTINSTSLCSIQPLNAVCDPGDIVQQEEQPLLPPCPPTTLP